jgi:hypothetical protein
VAQAGLIGSVKTMLLISTRVHATKNMLQSCLSGHMLTAAPALVGIYSSSKSNSSSSNSSSNSNSISNCSSGSSSSRGKYCSSAAAAAVIVVLRDGAQLAY